LFADLSTSARDVAAPARSTVGLQIPADAITEHLLLRALDLAASLVAPFARKTGILARSTVVGVGREISAGSTAGREPRRASQGTRTAVTQLPGAAGGDTVSAMKRVGIGIGTAPIAEALVFWAVHGTGALSTAVARWA